MTDPAGPFETGRHVRKIQQALIDEGFQLPVHGVDGVYGPETATAVSQFKTDQQSGRGRVPDRPAPSDRGSTEQ